MQTGYAVYQAWLNFFYHWHSLMDARQCIVSLLDALNHISDPVRRAHAMFEIRSARERYHRAMAELQDIVKTQRPARR